MIIERKTMGFLKVRLFFEPVVDAEALKRRYSSIAVHSYDRLVMPGFSVKVKKTNVIDLIDEEKVFSSFNKTTRNEIRRADSLVDLKVEHFAILDGLFAGYYETIYCRHERAQGRCPEPLSAFGRCRVVLARYRGEMISGVAFWECGQGVLRIKTISSKRLEERNKDLRNVIGYSTRKLIWEICRYGLANGFVVVDLAYVNLQDSKKHGITQFKLGFGGRIIDEYTYEYRSPVVRLLGKIRR